MFDYLQQFKNLPKELQDYVSSEEAMKSLDEIEAKHGVKLAGPVMRIMVKDLTLGRLPLFLASEFSLGESEAKQVVKELKEGVLRKAASHLGFEPTVVLDSLEDKLDNILKDGLISFPSQNIIDRFKLVAGTYLRGVRSKIDTRMAMQKSVEAGGLGLSIEKTDILLSLLDGKNFKIDIPKKSSALDDLIKNKIIQPEYSLSASIEERKKKMLSEEKLDVKIQDNLALNEIKEKNHSLVPENLPFPILVDDGLKQNIENKEDAKLEIKVEDKAQIIKPHIAEPEEITAFLKKINGQDLEKTNSELSDVKKPLSSIAMPLPKTFPVAPPVIPVLAKSVATQTPTIDKKITDNEIKIEVKQQPREALSSVEQVKPSVEKLLIVPEPKISQSPAPQITPPQRAVNSYGINVSANQNSGEQGRIRMDDVRTSPRVMGPVEELRFLDLVNFRRLASTPAEATTKIFSKIKLLEKSGYDRMTSGIAAWRQNEVNHLYLQIYKESAFKGRPLLEIIEDLKVRGEQYLSPEEMDAIMDLNAKLLF